MNAINPTRRDVLVAAVAASAAVAYDASVSSLTADELRVLAMAATPPEAWAGREDDYYRTRVVEDGTHLHRTVWDLEARGLVSCAVTGDPDLPWKATATPAGLEALRAAGVLS